MKCLSPLSVHHIAWFNGKCHQWHGMRLKNMQIVFVQKRICSFISILLERSPLCYQIKFWAPSFSRLKLETESWTIKMVINELGGGRGGERLLVIMAESLLGSPAMSAFSCVCVSCFTDSKFRMDLHTQNNRSGQPCHHHQRLHSRATSE